MGLTRICELACLTKSHIYIADAQGKIRYDHIGEGAYDEIDNTVASLLLEQENQKPKGLVMG